MRVLELILIAIAAVPVAFICLILGALIWLDSGGPVLFRQTRVGKDQKSFTLYKLRTMTVDVRDAPTHEIPPDYITRVGRYIRHLKLDELPQLYNVWKNEMRLVGPRPSLTSQRQLIEFRASKNVYSMRPGITGLAQIADVDFSEPERVSEIDAEYIRTRTLLLDIKIIFLTVFKVLSKLFNRVIHGAPKR